jgi:cytochrome c biogenesis protein CcmG/thiol:disulfide interchange protein DsbE
VIRWLAVLPLVALAALAALFIGYGLKHNPHFNPDALVGRKAPRLMLVRQEGGAPTPIRSAGQGPVLINVFGSWCAPCAEEAPALMAMKEEGVPMIGIAYKDTPQKTQAFLDRYGNPFQAVFQDPDGRAGIEFGISGVPETFAVGADGTVLAKQVGPLTPAGAEKLAERIGR